MPNAPEIRRQVARWIVGEIPLRQFEDWFVPATWNVREDNPDAESLVDEIEMSLSEYSDGVLNLEELRGEMTRIAHPFASRQHIAPYQVDEISFEVTTAAPQKAVQRVLGPSQVTFHHLLVA